MLYTTIKMDRPIDKDKHIISPGGYALLFENETEPIRFDYTESDCQIDDSDPAIIHYNLSSLDDSYTDKEKLTTWLKTKKIKEMTEFFVYTGETTDPELNPISVLSVRFDLNDGTIIDIPENILCKPTNGRQHKERNAVQS